MKTNSEFLDELFSIIKERKNGDPEKSYTARLYKKGTEKIAQKVGEEAVELIIAAMKGKRKEIISESADLLFHLLILWSDNGISLEKVLNKLHDRRGVSGLDEKRSRNKME